jgi:hypothetical protein
MLAYELHVDSNEFIKENNTAVRTACNMVKATLDPERGTDTSLALVLEQAARMTWHIQSYTNRTRSKSKTFHCYIAQTHNE